MERKKINEIAMKNNFNEIKKELFNNDFSILENNQSNYFGNEYIIFTNNKILIRIVLDRGLLGIDIASFNEKQNYFDIMLFFNILTKNENLILNIMEIDINNFLEQHLDSIIDMMSDKQLKSTKQLLETLEEKRAKQLFPSFV